jgi:hypothetical protein
LGFSIFSACFTTKVFTRANYFWKHLTKSRGPYSNRTTKEKARTIKRTSQKSPRNKAMNDRLSCSRWRVNAPEDLFDKLAAAFGPVPDKVLVGRTSLEVYLP